MSGKITALLTKKEAEVYRAQGLFEEARKLYGQLLDSSPNIDPELKSAVESKIQGINQELGESKTRKPCQLTPAEVCYMRKGWDDNATAPDMLVCAQAFIQIGAYDEALKEYKNLIHNTGVKKSYLEPIALCLVHLHAPQQLPFALEQLARAVTESSKIFLAIQVALAKQIAVHHYNDHALAIYKYMRKYAQLSAWLEPRIAALSSTRDISP